MGRIEKLEIALAKAESDVEEARACGVIFCAAGPVFYAETIAIRDAIRASLDSAILDALAA